MEPKISVLVPYRGYIAPLKVHGPIVQPLSLTRKEIMQLLNCGLKPVHYNRLTKERTVITKDNIDELQSHPGRAINAKIVRATTQDVTPFQLKQVPEVRLPDPVELEEGIQEFDSELKEFEGTGEPMEGVDGTVESTLEVINEDPVQEPVADVVDKSALYQSYLKDIDTLTEADIDFTNLTEKQAKKIREKLAAKA